MKRKVIDDTLEIITARMNELKEEQEQLNKFLALEKDRRCIESALASKELDEINEAINVLEVASQQGDTKRADCINELNNLIETISKLEADMISGE